MEAPGTRAGAASQEPRPTLALVASDPSTPDAAYLRELCSFVARVPAIASRYDAIVLASSGAEPLSDLIGKMLKVEDATMEQDRGAATQEVLAQVTREASNAVPANACLWGETSSI